MSSTNNKFIPRESLAKIVNAEKKAGRTIVFTNGCFDIIHRGHVEYLEYAKRLGDILIIGVNSDASVKRLKGPKRPVNKLYDRMYVLAALYMTDYITSFDEDTPYNLINEIKPHVLVKAGDYKIHDVVGRDIVESYGGKVILAPYVEGYSTTIIIEKAKE